MKCSMFHNKSKNKESNTKIVICLEKNLQKTGNINSNREKPAKEQFSRKSTIIARESHLLEILL